MNITLRKANAIQSSINEALKNMEFPDTISINEFQDVENLFFNANLKFSENVSRRQDLIEALYEIRKAVSAANQESNVDSHLAEVARLEKDIQFYGKYATSKEREPSAVITGKLEKVRNRKEGYYLEQEVSSSIFSADQLIQFKKSLADSKKLKQKLQDELLEINVRKEISLSAKTVMTLSKENII